MQKLKRRNGLINAHPDESVEWSGAGPPVSQRSQRFMTFHFFALFSFYEHYESWSFLKKTKLTTFVDVFAT